MADADPSSLVAQMMADLGQSNPQMAALAQLMSDRANASSGIAAELHDEEVAALKSRLDAALGRIERLRVDGKRLLAAHELATDRLARLAAALGACGLCWGEDARCPSCHGRGRPGMVRPDPDARAALLHPGDRQHTARQPGDAPLRSEEGTGHVREFL